MTWHKSVLLLKLVRLGKGRESGQDLEGKSTEVPAGVAMQEDIQVGGHTDRCGTQMAQAEAVNKRDHWQPRQG